AVDPADELGQIRHCGGAGLEGDALEHAVEQGAEARASRAAQVAPAHPSTVTPWLDAVPSAATVVTTTGRRLGTAPRVWAAARSASQAATSAADPPSLRPSASSHCVCLAGGASDTSSGSVSGSHHT